MKFGQQLKADAIPEWRPHYLDYKALKKHLKAGMFAALCRMDPSQDIGRLHLLPDSLELDSFVQMLLPEVQKVEKFFQRQLACEQSNIHCLETALSSLSLSQQNTRQQNVQQLMQSVQSILEHLPLLEKFAHQNEEGLRKIVKKFNKVFFSSLSPQAFTQGCSFLTAVRRAPLVNIHTGVNTVHTTLLGLIQPHPNVDRCLAIPAPAPDLSRLDLATLQQHFHRPLKDAAKHFGVCVTVFKRICRSCGIKRWPARKVMMVRAKKAKLCKRIGINEDALGEIQPTADPTGEVLLKRLQQAALDQIPPERRRIKIWDRLNRRKLTGMAAPLEANLKSYLEAHPERELYNGQDREVGVKEEQQVAEAAAPEELVVSGDAGFQQNSVGLDQLMVMEGFDIHIPMVNSGLLDISDPVVFSPSDLR